MYKRQPYTTDKEGRGPAWANSLFEDNAEYGLGMAIASRQIRDKIATLADQMCIRDRSGRPLYL